MELKAQGLVQSVAGVRGGYVLSKAPDRITMGQIVRNFDDILAPIACVSTHGYRRCSQESVCRFRRVFLVARNVVSELMDNATLAEVAKGLPVEANEVFREAFSEGGGI